jgi:hypothetical protein
VVGLKKTARPGFPFTGIFDDTEEFLDNFDITPDVIEYIEWLSLETTTKRIGRACSTEEKTELMKELINEGRWDLPETFVKNELHSNEKLKNGRYRLIFAFSVLHRLVQKVLFKPLNDQLVDDNKTNEKPSAARLGCGNSDRDFENHDAMRKRWPEGKQASDDVQGWDMSCSEWKLMRIGENYLQQYSNQPDWLRPAMMNYMFMYSQCWAITSDGRVLHDPRSGVQFSGGGCTSKGNSDLRNIDHTYVFGDLYSMTAGDDCLERVGERSEPSITEAYLQLGVHLKEMRIHEDTDDFEFCSHTFNGGRPYPTNVGKAVGNILHRGLNHEELYSHVEDWRNKPGWIGYFLRKLAEQASESWGSSEN